MVGMHNGEHTDCSPVSGTVDTGTKGNLRNTKTQGTDKCTEDVKENRKSVNAEGRRHTDHPGRLKRTDN